MSKLLVYHRNGLPKNVTKAHAIEQPLPLHLRYFRIWPRKMCACVHSKKCINQNSSESSRGKTRRPSRLSKSNLLSLSLQKRVARVNKTLPLCARSQQKHITQRPELPARRSCPPDTPSRCVDCPCAGRCRWGSAWCWWRHHFPPSASTAIGAARKLGD